MSTPDTQKKCRCNLCHQRTEHDIVDTHVEEGNFNDGSTWHERTEVLRCRGCKTLTICKEYRDSDWDEGEVEKTYVPPRLWVLPQKWLEELEELDPALFALLKEVYLAANKYQVRLLSMGVRAAVDHAMVKIVGDVGPFDKKLEKMVQQSHISEKQQKMLETVIDAGSAAAHRGYRPPRALLEHMISIMETIIREHYFTGPMLKIAEKQIPPRPPRSNAHTKSTQPDDI